MTGYRIPLVVALALVVGSGCSSLRPDPPRLDADHHRPQLHGALNKAETLTGMKAKRTWKVNFVETDCIYHGEPSHCVEGWGGRTSNQNWTKLTEYRGSIGPRSAVHEAGHKIMFDNRIPADQHHSMMRTMGFWMGAKH